ncbi:MAG TPA: type II secretion system minor pseudopilin GspK [Steroidobacteraceae bacterium]|jgi:general secretion pathway protein K|nr:type II secretion system minor pseudopilin GspK [Steroidobacteraceae bacterium]
MSAAPRTQRQRPRAPRAAQRGIALLVAILLVALGTMLAAAIAYENAMTARRGASTFAFDEALLVQQGAEALAAFGLREVWRLSAQQPPQGGPYTYANQGWAKPLGPIEVVPGVMLEASLEDLQGRFNLNNLVNADGSADPTQLLAFQQLLTMLGLEPKWAGYTLDWISHNPTPSIPDGAKDSVYMGQNPPYRAPLRYITSASELLALPGFGHDRYVLLAPYVAALPPRQYLNICTASGVVLDAFLGHQEFADPQGQALARNREAAPGCFPKKADYQAAFGRDPAAWNKVQSEIQVNSHYFRLTSFISIGSTEFNLYSLLYQDGQNAGAVRPILRSFTAD